MPQVSEKSYLKLLQRYALSYQVVLPALTLLLVLNVYQWHQVRSQQDTQRDVLEEREVELVRTFAHMDGLSKQLQRSQDSVQRTLSLMAQAEQQYEQLQQQHMLQQTQAQQQAHRLDSLQEEVQRYRRQISQQHSQLLGQQRKQQQLLQELDGLRASHQQLTKEHRSMQEERQQLLARLKRASKLRLTSNQLFEIADKGLVGVQAVRERTAKGLQVVFVLGPNEQAESGDKLAVVRFLDPEGNVLQREAGEGGMFTFQGKELQYTAKQLFYFDNDRPSKLYFTYHKTGAMPLGSYRLEIYCDNQKIGEVPVEMY